MAEHDKIGIIGLGLVGYGLARILLDRKYTVYGYDIKPDACEKFALAGGRVCRSPQEVGEKASIVLLSLMTSQIVETVLFGQDGLIGETPKVHVVMDTSTGDPEKTPYIALRLSSQNVHYIESPISGSSAEIAARKATYLICGSQAGLNLIQPVFEALTERSYYLGDEHTIGRAGKAKLAINLIVGLNRAALAEGILFAEKNGLDLQQTLELFKNSSAYSHVMNIKGKKMITSDFSTQAKLSQHRKDVGLILDLCQKNQQKLPFSELHYSLLRDAEENGDGEIDNSAIIKIIREKTP